MKRLLLFGSLSLSIVVCFSACEQQEAVPFAPCPNAGAFVKQATKLRGTVYYDSTRGSYGVQVATNFDSADIGFTCNLPAKFQKQMMKVRFTGSYYAYDRPVIGPVGYNYYYLTLESISQ